MACKFARVQCSHSRHSHSACFGFLLNSPLHRGFGEAAAATFTGPDVVCAEPVPSPLLARCQICSSRRRRLKRICPSCGITPEVLNAVRACGIGHNWGGVVGIGISEIDILEVEPSTCARPGNVGCHRGATAHSAQHVGVCRRRRRSSGNAAPFRRHRGQRSRLLRLPRFFRLFGRRICWLLCLWQDSFWCRRRVCSQSCTHFSLLLGFGLYDEGQVKLALVTLPTPKRARLGQQREYGGGAVLPMG
jgi:hypothetical protein